MTFYKYILVSIVSLILFTLIINYNSVVTNHMIEVNNLVKHLTQIQSIYYSIESLEKFKEISSNSDIQHIERSILNSSNYRNILDNIVIDNSDSILSTIENLRIKAKEKVENEYIALNKIRFKRNSIFILLVIFIFLFLFIELILITKDNENISRYLKNITIRKFDFDINSSSIPYINEINEEITKLRDSSLILEKSINASLKGFSLREVLQGIFYNDDFRKYLDFQRIGFAEVDSKFIVAGLSLSYTNDIKLDRGYSIKRGESESLEHLLRTNEVRIIGDLEKHYNDHPNSLSTELILDEGFKSSLTLPLHSSEGKAIGILFFSAVKKNTYCELDKEKLALLLDMFSSIFEKNMLIEALVRNSALSFVKLVEGKDPETRNHIERMAEYSRIIAKNLSKTEKYEKRIDYFYVDNIYKSAPLHDIGKVGIPDHVLLKPGKLTKEEFDTMKEHPNIGARVLNYYQNNLRRYDIEVFDTAVEIAIAHHERWDGTGYPLGKKGKEIPLSARIVAIADVFDGLSSKRVYKEAYSYEKSVKMIKKMSGKNFDPDIVSTFLDSLDEIKLIYDEMKEV